MPLSPTQINALEQLVAEKREFERLERLLGDSNIEPNLKSGYENDKENIRGNMDTLMRNLPTLDGTQEKIAPTGYGSSADQLQDLLNYENSLQGNAATPPPLGVPAGTTTSPGATGSLPSAEPPTATTMTPIPNAQGKKKAPAEIAAEIEKIVKDIRQAYIDFSKSKYNSTGLAIDWKNGFAEPKIGPNGVVSLTFPNAKKAIEFHKELAANNQAFIVTDENNNVLAYSKGDGKLLKPDGSDFDRSTDLSPGKSPITAEELRKSLEDEQQNAANPAPPNSVGP